jgi:hypothetical protein
MQCQTCAELLLRLSDASERLFYVSSELSSAVLSWSADREPPPSEELLLTARALRAECALIRETLEEHRERGHGDSYACAS